MKLINLSACILAVAVAVPCNFGQTLTHGKAPKLPKPFTKPIEANPSHSRPQADFVPKAPDGFKVSVFYRGIPDGRYLAVAPNGDVFVSDPHTGKIYVLADPGNGKPASNQTVFADGLNEPFGIAFHGHYVYVGATDQVVRYRYDPKTSKPSGDGQKVLDLPSGGMHFTRTVAFGDHGRKMFVSVGSDCNACVEKDDRRAAITVADPDGKNSSIYASGLRNAVGLAVDPQSGDLWADVNERDMMGDNLPPEFFTSIKPHGFYGWPYSYIGKNLDPRVKHQRPDLVAKAIVPDVLLQAHTAPLECVFYTADQFPEQYHNGAFIAEHGSWNRSVLSGYKVVFVPFRNGRPSAPPSDFLTGFNTDPHSDRVNGRPVGVAVSKDGSLLVSDDTGGVIWRVSYSK